MNNFDLKKYLIENKLTFNSILQEETTDFEYKQDSGGGKPTMVLKLGTEAWEKVKHLFNEKGRPISDEVKRIPVGKYAWDLHAQPLTAGNGTVLHRIYGVAGDWTFGNAPTYYEQKYSGNIKAATKVFTDFIEKYLK